MKERLAEVRLRGESPSIIWRSLVWSTRRVTWGALVFSLPLGRRDLFALTSPNSQENRVWACSSGLSFPFPPLSVKHAHMFPHIYPLWTGVCVFSRIYTRSVADVYAITSAKSFLFSQSDCKCRVKKVSRFLCYKATSGIDKGKGLRCGLGERVRSMLEPDRRSFERQKSIPWSTAVCTDVHSLCWNCLDFLSKAVKINPLINGTCQCKSRSTIQAITLQ